MAKKHRSSFGEESPELTIADFAKAKRMRDVMPEVVKAMKRGRPKLADAKVRVSLRLDPGVVAAYKATGAGWQSRINEVLKRAVPRRAARRRTRAA